MLESAPKAPSVQMGQPPSAAVKAQLPTVKAQLPVVKAQLPTVKAQLPVVKAQLPTVKAQLPVVKAQLPVVKAQLPTVKGLETKSSKVFLYFCSSAINKMDCSSLSRLSSK